MINANMVRKMMKDREEKIKTEAETIAIRIVEELITPSIVEAAKRGWHSVYGKVEEKHCSYVRKELENQGFITQYVSPEKLRILW